MDTDVAIVGAGPAGLAAARTLLPSGLKVTLIDEQQRPGGQILRQPPREFQVRGWLSDPIYRAGKSLLQELEGDGRIQWLTGTTVLGIAGVPATSEQAGATRTLWINGPDGTTKLHARHVLIAPGCYDMPVSFPGSTLPGVMAAGAIQAFLKSQQLIAGESIVLAGTHPLQLIVADQIHRAGGTVKAVLFAQSKRRLLSAALGNLAAIVGSGQVLHMIEVLRRLRRAGIPVKFSETVVQAHGNGSLERITVAPINAVGDIDRAVTRDIECDRLGVCFGFLASSELTRQAGIDHVWSANGGGWLSRCDEWMRTSQAGISVAGEITGVAGAQVAFLEGQLAAFGILRELGKQNDAEVRHAAQPVRRRLKTSNAFAHVLQESSAPAWKLLRQLMQDESVLCKCEGVTVGQFQSLLAGDAAPCDVNSAKLVSRAGMGLCQGRYCQHAVTRLIAERCGVAESDVGSFTAQLPIKPVPIGALEPARALPSAQ